MGVSGYVAAGAMDELERLFRQQLATEELSQRQKRLEQDEAQSLRAEQLQRDRMAADQEWRNKSLESDDRARRDRANAAGVEDLFRQGEAMDKKEREQKLLDGLNLIANDPNVPESTRRAFGARAAGVTNVDPEDFVSEDDKTKRIENEAEARARASAKYREPDDTLRAYVNENGETVWGSPNEARGRRVGSAASGGNAGARATAEDKKQAGRVSAAKEMLTRMRELSQKINTSRGPKAGVSGLVRRGQAAIGIDPDVAEYERLRAAAGRAVGVAALGAQGYSNADASAYSNLMPGAGTDSATAKRLFDQLQGMLDNLGGSEAPSDEETPLTEITIGRDPKTGKLTRQRK